MRTPESPNNVGGPINNQITIGSSPAAGLRIRYNDGILIAGNTLSFLEQRRMTALDLEGSRGAVVSNQFTGAAGVGDDTAGITGLANSTTSDAKRPKTEWKRIPGGFAVKVTLEDDVVVGLMRGGPRLKTPPEKIEGYGHSTEKEFAWYHVQNGKLIHTGSRHAASPQRVLRSKRPPLLDSKMNSDSNGIMSNPFKLLIDGPNQADLTVILAHGAGSGMDTEFMNAVAAGIANNGFRVVRFEFPYMVKRRETGQKRPPDREPILRETWFNVIEQVETAKFVIGGKSMGGRIASLMADEVGVAGLICLGYPFHPTGKPDKLRIEHLKSLSTPMLILQGERDPFGNYDEVLSYDLSSQVQIHWLPDGDHSFTPRKRSSKSWEDNLEESVKVITDFLNNL